MDNITAQHEAVRRQYEETFQDGYFWKLPNLHLDDAEFMASTIKNVYGEGDLDKEVLPESHYYPEGDSFHQQATQMIPHLEDMTSLGGGPDKILHDAEAEINAMRDAYTQVYNSNMDERLESFAMRTAPQNNASFHTPRVSKEQQFLRYHKLLGPLDAQNHHNGLLVPADHLFSDNIYTQHGAPDGKGGRQPFYFYDESS